MDIYLKLTKENNYEDMMDYVYPKLFTLASKEQMVEVFSGLETMGISMKFDELDLLGIEPLLIEEKQRYAFGSYAIKARLILQKEELRRELVVSAMQTEFEKQFGEGNISYDEDSYTFTVKGNRYLLGVQDDQYGEDWYFLDYDINQPQIVEMLLPANVVEKTKAKIKQ